MNTEHFAIILADTGHHCPQLSNPTNNQLSAKENYLKQQENLLELTLERLKKLIPRKNIFVLVSKQLESYAREQLDLDVASCIVVESGSRNLIPLIAFTCYKINSIEPAASIVLLSTSCQIINLKKTRELSKALYLAQQVPAFLTFGIHPSHPSIKNRYIGYSDEHLRYGFKRTTKIVEKPSEKEASNMLDNGKFVWNSGIIISSVFKFIAELNTIEPSLNQWLMKGLGMYNTVVEPEFFNLFKIKTPHFYTPKPLLMGNKDLYVLPLFGIND